MLNNRIKTCKQSSSSLLRVKLHVNEETQISKRKKKKKKNRFYSFFSGCQNERHIARRECEIFQKLVNANYRLVREDNVRRRACSVAANVILRRTGSLKSRISIYPASPREYRRRVMLDVSRRTVSPPRFVAEITRAKLPRSILG